MKNLIAIFTLLVFIALVVSTLAIEIKSFLIDNNAATITDEEAAKIQETVISKLGENGYQLRGAE